MNELFFELIQVAIGSRVCLSHTPRADEWKQLYEMAKKQSLVGVCFAGVQKLGFASYDNVNDDDNLSNASNTSNLTEMLYLTWMGMAAKIQQRNEAVNRQCVEVQKMLAEKGFRSCIFKGQAVAALYRLHDNDDDNDRSATKETLGSSKNPSNLSNNSNLSQLRQSGDIDIWIEGGKKRVIELVQEIAPTKEIRETHAHLDVFPDTEVEAHYRPGLIRNFVKNAKLQKFFQEEAEACFSNRINLSNTSNSSNHSEPLTIVAPTTEFNLVHQLTHIYHHLFTEGVGLRQVMDYYFVLQSTKGSRVQEVQKVKKVISDLGLERFASALMWVIGYVFEGKNIETSETSETFRTLGIKPNEADGRFLLNEIMHAGNFGREDSRYDLHNMNALQSLVRITTRNLSLLRFSPFDWFWSPLWRGYHYCSRKFNGYK